MSSFMESLHQRLGHHAEVRDLVELGVKYTLQYNPYDDKSWNAEMFPILDKESEVTPEWEDQYVTVEILLPRGDRMARGHTVCWKHDADGNPIGRSNQNPILDTCLYDMKFPGVEKQNWQLTSLQSKVMTSVMSVKMNTFYHRHSSIKERIVQFSV